MPILPYGIKCYLCHTDTSTLKQYRVMKHLTILLSTLMLTSVSFAMAQEDDMYFSPKKAKKTPARHKVEVVYEDEEPEERVPAATQTPARTESMERDVDEYNRRGRSTQSSTGTQEEEEDNTDTRQARTYELSSQNLYDLGYSEGYRRGYDDGEDDDYYYGIRLARFHGRHFYDPWYWGSISLVYDPWYWDPWHYDPWYRPYYYGGWCSVGWGIGYWGSYWHTPWYGWHHSHWGHWGGNYYGPRYSTVRNRDYGRTRIVNRNTRVGDYGRYASRANSSATSGRISNGRLGSGRLGNGNLGTGRTSTDRINQRSVDRYNRATERAGSRNNTSTGRSRTTVDRTNRSTERTNRSTERTSRSTERSSSRMGSSSSSRSGMGGGFGGGHSSGGGRSMGGGSRGGGRGR